MRPLIGIPPRWREQGRDNAGDVRLGLAPVAALEAAGAAAVILPPQSDPKALAARLDGLLLPGGGDFLPDRPYPPEVVFDPVAPRQRAFDEDLLAASLARELPVLGICYGMQLLALHCGGRLHYDLPTDLPTAAPHRLGEGRHALRVESGSSLARALGSATGPVNSRHHQAVADAGRARVAATSPDGVIEAIELAEGFAIGVQWHPEDLESGQRDPLFRSFVAACSVRRA
ncbi:MAG TPA: gamma-glutamyl-gamma-aminobutyrate hydrolase family protein [Myxococcota bacterium]|nr:gamma-glutamyl-gamma-aminobutyrate hydrolase family protein [Myxococcota bacterium]